MSERGQGRASLVSMLKHDLNNTLTGVKTGLEIMAMDDAFDGTELGDELKDVVSSARRMALMIEDLGFVFADQANQQVTCEETPLREILEHLEVFTEGQGISYDVDVSDVETLAAQAAPLARSIYYGLAVFKAFSQESAQLSVRRKGGRCNVILHLKGDILEPLTACFAQKVNDREAQLAQLSRLCVQKIGGQLSLKAKQGKGFLIWSTEAS